jgi:adenylyltransferase/sulfurtransferase
VPNCAEAGVLGVLPGVMGLIQATEALKIIVGVGELLTGRLLTYDALGMRFDEFSFARRENCAVCGDHATITAPQDLAEVCSAADLAAVERIGPRDLRDRLEQRPDEYILIDVREPQEFESSHLPRSLNIPVKELEGRIAEVPTGRRAVFVCRSGARSLTASGLAHRLGVQGSLHLEGGLLAWQREVDSSLDVAPVA